jgi:hypothetical protein
MIKLIIITLCVVNQSIGLSINTDDRLNAISSDNELDEQLWHKFKVRLEKCAILCL